MVLPVPEFYVGVDLGKKVDYTAIAIVECRPGGTPHFLTPWEEPRDFYGLRHLERIPLGTSYPRVVDRVVRVTRDPALQRRCTLVVDASCVGEPIVDALRRRDLDCHMIAVTITGGLHETGSGDDRTIPRQSLIHGLEVMLEEEELKIAGRLPNRGRLLEELMNLRVERTRGGATKYGAAAARVHDDTVIAVALACWAARRGKVGPVGKGRIV